MKPLIEQGYIYKVVAPLYKIDKLNPVYLYSKEELENYLKTEPSAQVLRFKGLGAMEPDDTEFSLSNPKTRILQQLTTSDIEETISLYNTLLGKDISSRKELVMMNKEEFIDE